MIQSGNSSAKYCWYQIKLPPKPRRKTITGVYALLDSGEETLSRPFHGFGDTVAVRKVTTRLLEDRVGSNLFVFLLTRF